MALENDGQSAPWHTHSRQSPGFHNNCQARDDVDRFTTTLKNLREISLVTTHSRGRVLDAGAGTGRLTIPLYDASFDVVGVDVSAEMLNIARQRAGERDIEFLQGSIFKLPFDDGSFDTVVSITIMTQIPQWADILREYVRILRPGGRLIFNLKSRPHVDFSNRKSIRFAPPTDSNRQTNFMTEVDTGALTRCLAALDATATHIIPYDAFNSNYVLQGLLGPRYDTIMVELEELFQAPGAIELWNYIETSLFQFLPLTVSYEFMVVAELDGVAGSPKPWAPPTLDLDGAPVEAAQLEVLMGEAYPPFIAGLRHHLQSPGAIQLLLTLDSLIGPCLPVSVDFLSLFDLETRAMILDQAAWRWSRGFLSAINAGLHDRQDVPLAPLMEYQSFQQFVKVLKPLVGER